MIKTANRLLYRAFGLKIESDIVLPELLHIEEDCQDTVDMTIQYSNLAELWNECSTESYEFIVKENGVIFKIEHVALFRMESGKKITVSPKNEDYDEDLLRLYILGTCMGILLMQRGVYPLHGSAVAIDGKAYAVIGDSGAGKSTLASTLLSRGYQLISDDVIAISFSSDNKQPLVTPSYPQQKLWQESLLQFGMESNGLRSVYGRETKYCIPVAAQYVSKPLPLSGIFELNKSTADDIQLERVQGLEQLHILYRHTYRNFMVSRLSLLDWHFNASTSIAKHTDIHRIQRPMKGFTAHDLASRILDSIQKEGE